jgi:hypothetical protein
MNWVLPSAAVANKFNIAVFSRAIQRERDIIKWQEVRIGTRRKPSKSRFFECFDAILTALRGLESPPAPQVGLAASQSVCSRRRPMPSRAARLNGAG